MYNEIIVEEIIKFALKEDINYCDITTEILISEEHQSIGKIIAKEQGVLAGIPVLKQVFRIVDSQLELRIFINDGHIVQRGDIIATITGKTKSILKGERVALNFIQRMSGIAKKSRDYADLVKDMNIRIVDTRKTLPNLRILDKYAVRAGGCYNHRFNLSDSILIKDNHIEAIGCVKTAIYRAKRYAPHTMKVEIEVKTINQLLEALDVGVDLILLDNMTCAMMKEAVKLTNKRSILEASGNITMDNIQEVASTRVDVISIGELTHSVRALDISMCIEKLI